jgi:hypothetical protein
MIRQLDAKRAQLVAGAGGALYILIIVLGALGEGVVRGSIVVPGNATATASNLRSMEWLWRLGVVGEIVVLTCATALALVLYVLLRRVRINTLTATKPRPCWPRGRRSMWAPLTIVGAEKRFWDCVWRHHVLQLDSLAGWLGRNTARGLE